MKNNKTNILSACLLTFGVASSAYALPEIESNDSVAGAQLLTNANVHTIDGVMGILGGDIQDDLDFFTFQANAGDVLEIDIDKGFGGAGYINTIVGIFDASGTLLRMNDTASSLDTGSISVADARIDGFVAPASGTYTVGVSTFPRFFNLDGSVPVTSSTSGPIGMDPSMGPAGPVSLNPAGDYTLIISGISSRTKQINIEVKPGSKELSPLNPHSQGKIPVAIMGAAGFSVNEIKQNKLSFGSTGNEQSLNKCQKVSHDINRDGYADLLCHFENSAAGFKSGDIEGILKGEMNGGIRFEGRSVLKVVPSKRK